MIDPETHKRLRKLEAELWATQLRLFNLTGTLYLFLAAWIAFQSLGIWGAIAIGTVGYIVMAVRETTCFYTQETDKRILKSEGIE